jgi:putative oxidoreductase
MKTDELLTSFAMELSARGVLRIVAGLLFLEHGLSKLIGFPHNPAFDHLQLLSLEGVAGTLELFGGFLVMVGLFARQAAFVLSGEMAFAYFLAHAPRNLFPGLNGGDAAILFCFVFLYVSAAGPGRWSLDELRGTVRRPSRTDDRSSVVV